MNQTQKGILTLIRSAITGQSLPLPEDFDIEKAYPHIKRHCVIPLAYEGALQCGIPMDSPVMLSLLDGYGQNFMVSEEQMAAIRAIFTAFDENGIDYMPLKGCNMKPLYPKPELRVMGDADILIRVEQYPRIVPIMEKLGFQYSKESNHEFVWHSKQLFLELHKCLIPSYNKDYYKYFGNGWRLAKHREGTRYTMTQEDTLVYLFTHFAKHYRDGGIGCLHVADLWVFLRSHPELDEKIVRTELSKLQLVDFYDNIRALIHLWFEDGEETEKTQFITDFIFQSGIWGKKESYILARETRHAKAAGSLRGGRLRSFRTALFPGLESMREQYPILEKHSWLMPFLWPVRLVHIVLFRRDRIVARKNKWKLSSADNIQSYQQALTYVGLNFGFEE